MLLSVFLLAAPSLAGPPAAAPADTPEDIVAYREVIMKQSGAHMKASAFVVKGKVNRKEDLAAQARALHDISLSFGSLFPAGTGPDKVKTDAKAEIWSKPEEFTSANKAFQEATQAFVEATTKGDAASIKAAFGKVGKSCGGCHDTFRVDDEP